MWRGRSSSSSSRALEGSRQPGLEERQEGLRIDRQGPLGQELLGEGLRRDRADLEVDHGLGRDPALPHLGRRNLLAQQLGQMPQAGVVDQHAAEVE